MEDERSVDSRFEFDSSYEREESDRNWMRNGKECRKKKQKIIALSYNKGCYYSNRILVSLHLLFFLYVRLFLLNLLTVLSMLNNRG